MVRQEIDTGKLLRTILHALRHDPSKYGLRTDSVGWVHIWDLVCALRGHHSVWRKLYRKTVEALVQEIAPSRLEISQGRIRATYGHSISVLKPSDQEPPECLYHGTSEDALPRILKEGLRPMGRQYVHLTGDYSYAGEVASGTAPGIILLIRARQAYEGGICFQKANHHVWLAQVIPPEFCEVVIQTPLTVSGP